MRTIPILAAALLVLAGCSSGRWVRSEFETTQPHDHLEIYLEHRIEDDLVVPQGFDHPLTVNQREFGLVLCGLLRWDSHLLKDDELVRVFEPSEIAALAPALTAALAAVSPDERIRFVTSDWEGGLLFSNERVTEGVLFVEPGGRFNIAFSEIDEELHPGEYSQSGRSRTGRDPTKITSTTRPLADRSWFTIRERPGEEGVYPLWGVIDLELARVEAAKEVVEPPEKPVEAPVAAQPEESSGPDKSKSAAIKEKLKLLKEMLDEGLISKEDYEQKKAELLDSF